MKNVPLPGPGEVRFRAWAIGVNFVDTAFRDGSFNSPLAAVGGVEAAGVINAVGPGVTDHAVGDRVGYFFAPGSYAKLRNVPAEVLIRLPDDIAFDDAAAIMTKGLTAWMTIRHLHPGEPSEAVLVQGAICNTASVAALTGPGEMSAYAASKHAVHGLTRVAAMENAARNIRVNTLAPGFTETPMVVANGAQNPAFAANATAAIPTKRAARPREVAEAAVWLCSDRASYVHGHMLVVDGGMTISEFEPQ